MIIISQNLQKDWGFLPSLLIDQSKRTEKLT